MTAAACCTVSVMLLINYAWQFGNTPKYTICSVQHFQYNCVTQSELLSIVAFKSTCSSPFSLFILSVTITVHFWDKQNGIQDSAQLLVIEDIPDFFRTSGHPMLIKWLFAVKHIASPAYTHMHVWLNVSLREKENPLMEKQIYSTIRGQKFNRNEDFTYQGDIFT